MCYPVTGMVHIKGSLLLIEKSSPCGGGSMFPVSLSECSFTICPTQTKGAECILNKTFPSFLLLFIVILFSFT